jgi:S1 RNA binding domain protein
MQLEVGSVVEAKITGITNFGAFAQIEGGKTGLIHISEIAVDFVKNIEDFVKVGDTLKVKVISCEKGKISLSAKKVIEEERAKKASRPAEVELFEKPKDENLSFEDKMSKFKQDSDERMLALKRNFESKRGSRRGY